MRPATVQVDGDTVCSICGSSSRIARGLCLGCLLRNGIDGNAIDDEQTLDQLLDKIDIRDADWRLGNYQILEEIGRGGMGVIYRARQRHSRRIVALKRVLSYHADSRETLARFRREAEAAASLDHPNILPIYEVGESEDGLPFFSMKFAGGGSLLDARPWLIGQPNEVVKLMAKVTSAVEYAHTQGILHRDLKPGNVLLDGRGEPMVSDFGLAKWLDISSDLTRTLTIFGTPGYIAPEQATGSAKNLTPAADIYSIGAVLFDLITGRPPFLGEHALAVIKQAEEKPAPKLRSLVPTIDRDLETICARSLEREPSARYLSAHGLGIDLQRWLDGRPILARPVSPPVRVWRWSRRNRRLATTALVCLSLGVAVLWLLRDQRKSERTIAEMQGKFSGKTGIAVLPFENFSDDNKNTFFVEGVQDEILNDLTKVADLKVISRTSVMEFKPGVMRDLQQIAKRLGVTYVLEGNVQRTGDRVRVSTQLFDVRKGTHVWAEHYDRQAVDVFTIENEVAVQIASQLRAKLSPQEKAAIETPPTKDLVAYEIYREAKSIDDTIKFDAKASEHLPDAERLLKRAIARDPGLFPAHCLLARVEDEIYFFGIDRTPVRLSAAQLALDGARRLQPDAGETHLSLAQHFYWAYRDYESARNELSIARRKLPNASSVLELSAYIDRRQGQWETAIQAFRRALELDPLNIALHQQLSATYLYLRRFPEAAETLDRALLIAPDDITTRVYRSAIDIWRDADLRPLRSTIDSLLQKNPKALDEVAEHCFQLAVLERNADDAQEALRRLGPAGFYAYSFPNPYALCEAYVAQLRGDSRAASDALSRARTEIKRMLNQQPAYAEALSVLGFIEAGLGHKEEAIQNARRAAELLPIAKDARGGAIIIENLALSYAWLGDKDKAIEQLRVAAPLAGDLNYGDLRLNPRWDALRGDPRFEKIVASFAPGTKR